MTFVEVAGLWMPMLLILILFTKVPWAGQVCEVCTMVYQIWMYMYLVEQQRPADLGTGSVLACGLVWGLALALAPVTPCLCSWLSTSRFDLSILWLCVKGEAH